jgi:hypothetical protein
VTPALTAPHARAVTQATISTRESVSRVSPTVPHAPMMRPAITASFFTSMIPRLKSARRCPCGRDSLYISPFSSSVSLGLVSGAAVACALLLAELERWSPPLPTLFLMMLPEMNTISTKDSGRENR